MSCGVCGKYVYHNLKRCNNCGYKLGAKKMKFKDIIKLPAPHNCKWVKPVKVSSKDRIIEAKLNKIYHIDSPSQIERFKSRGVV